MPRLMACTHSRLDPASRFRVVQFLPHLERAGWRISHRPNRPSRYWRPTLPLRPLRSIARRTGVGLRRLSRLRDVRDAAGFDVVWANRDLLEGDPRWEKRLLAANPRVVFDFDDAVYLGPEREDHIGWICEHAAWVTPGNDHLADFARRHTDRVTVIPSVVEHARYEPHPLCEAAPIDGRSGLVPGRPLRVGWLGSDLSIRQTLFPYWQMLGRLQRELGFEFVVCSWPRPEPPDGPLAWRFVAWTPATEERIGRDIDVGIMPLLDEPFQRGKCGMKLLQYLAAGVPVVASPVGVNRQLVERGGCGFLASDETAWGDGLARLLDPDTRRRLGMAGREFCRAEYSLEAWLPRLESVLSRVARGPSR
jgi:glycosyltransferase involved in cell wall biosynthesis